MAKAVNSSRRHSAAGREGLSTGTLMLGLRRPGITSSFCFLCVCVWRVCGYIFFS